MKIKLSREFKRKLNGIAFLLPFIAYSAWLGINLFKLIMLNFGVFIRINILIVLFIVLLVLFMIGVDILKEG